MTVISYILTLLSRYIHVATFVVVHTHTHTQRNIMDIHITLSTSSSYKSFVIICLHRLKHTITATNYICTCYFKTCGNVKNNTSHTECSYYIATLSVFMFALLAYITK